MITRSQFDTEILPHTLKYEGGYSNHPNDSGGETYRGIARKINPDWEGWAQVDKIKQSQSLTATTIITGLEPLVANFYWQRYFLPKDFDKLSDTDIALQLFDFNVNGGYSIAKVVNALAATGINTSATTFEQLLPFLSRVEPAAFISALLSERKKHYDTLIASNPDQSVFKNGWYSRLKQLAATYTPRKAVIGGGLLVIAAICGLMLYMRRKTMGVYRL